MILTLTEAFEAYMEHLKASGRSPRTLYTYGKDREQIQAFFGADKPLASILKTQVGKFLKSEELLILPNGKDRAPNTIAKTLCVLRQFLKWCHEQQWIEEIPLPKSL